MPAKWNRFLAQDDPNFMEVVGGVPRAGLNVLLCDEDVELIRSGYKCIWCLENIESAFDCPNDWCDSHQHAPKDRREEHLRVFARAFAGHVPGARTGADWERIADEMEERHENRILQRRLERAGMVTPQIIVPKGTT